jgi:uncharacterized membrane protein YgcG
MKRYATLVAVAIGAWLLLAVPAMAATPPVGPPYPDAVTGQRVYDNAGIFSTATIQAAEKLIAGIEARTGAQVAIYTQVKPESDNLDKANADALALMNQWGVGRKGFDDGLVILFDMQTNLRHGQVSLYAGSGYRAAFLSDSDRQRVFDEDMKPLLKSGDMDGGLMVGLQDIDANATPAHAAALEQGRQINALMALGAIALSLLLIGFAVAAWVRRGRDPVYIDDNSILMAAPPADLTPAMATLLLTERTSDRTVTAGLVDLAAHGCISFAADAKPLGGTETGIRYLGQGSGEIAALEAALLDDIDSKSKKHDGLLTPHILYRLLGSFDDFKDGLETTAVKRGWLNAKPSAVVSHWYLIAGFEIMAAIVVAFFLIFVQASAVLLLATGLALAGIVTIFLARIMPARTRQGAMLWAMLSAYRRTLKLTLAQAHSMGDVVKAKALPWVTTPDQAMAWGVAFGLDSEIETVLSRSMALGEEPQDPDGTDRMAGTVAWQPIWYATGSFTGHSGHASSSSSGLFSPSVIPDPSSIMAALGSITHPALPVSSSSSSSSSSFSSGSFGGGGGGGGGGAGGGF